MAYGDSQYSSAPLQFGNLSPIVEAAMERKKQQAQQQAQLSQAIAKMASSMVQQRQQQQTAPDASDVMYAQGFDRGGVARPMDELQEVERSGQLTPEELDMIWRSRQIAAEHARASAMNEPQHFAHGGVASSWSNPYPNENKYIDQYGHLADVTGMAGVLAHQRLAQQQMQQEEMQNAYAQATKLMEQQRNDAIGKALVSQSPEIAQDPRTQAMLQAGAHPMDAYKFVSQQQSDEADAKRQATKDWYGYAQADKNLYGGTPDSGSPNLYTDPSTGQQFYQTGRNRWSHVRGGGSQQSGPPDTSTTFDAYGREWRTGANGRPVLVPKGQAVTTDQLPTYAPQTVTPDEPAPQTGLPSPQTAQATPAPQGAGAPPSGSVRVVAPNGQAGTIPAANLDAALAAGYRQL